MLTTEIESDVLVWLVLSSTYITFWQMIYCSLQTKANKKAVLWHGNRTMPLDTIEMCSWIARFSLWQHGFLIKQYRDETSGNTNRSSGCTPSTCLTCSMLTS